MYLILPVSSYNFLNPFVGTIIALLFAYIIKFLFKPHCYCHSYDIIKYNNPQFNDLVLFSSFKLVLFSSISTFFSFYFDLFPHIKIACIVSLLGFLSVSVSIMYFCFKYTIGCSPEFKSRCYIVGLCLLFCILIFYPTILSSLYRIYYCTYLFF